MRRRCAIKRAVRSPLYKMRVVEDKRRRTTTKEQQVEINLAKRNY